MAARDGDERQMASPDDAGRRIAARDEAGWQELARDGDTSWSVRGSRADDDGLWAGLPGGTPAWERDLDALLAPALLTEPPVAVQQALLAAVLAAAAPVPVLVPVAVPVPARVAPAFVPTPAPAAVPVFATSRVSPPTAPPRPLPLAAYLLVAAVLVAYVAAMSWVQGALGGGVWLSTLVTQLLAVSELVAGRPSVGEPLSLVWLLLQRAPWLLLLPIGWFLWERDRASVGVA